MSLALLIEDVWKAYPDWTGQPRTLRAAFARRMPLLRRSHSRWALQGVSAELAEGRSLGLVGHNGAGKSTLLRLISGLGRPSRGSIAAHPDRASVLSLGTSFDLNLSGRENALTAALVAGLTRRQAAAELPAMLSFSELEAFVDAPVRTYSEGMKLRLAFGVVATLEPRLLVLDEVLSVGDAAFSEKCRGRIAELRESGTTVVLASHSPDDIASTCDQAMWLHHGAVRGYGDVHAVLADYDRAMSEATLARTPVGAASDKDALVLGENRLGSQEAAVESVSLDPAVSPSEARIEVGGELRLTLSLTAHGDPVNDPIIGVTLRRRSDDAVLIDLSSRSAGFTLGSGVRSGTIDLVIERIDLPAGTYGMDVGLYERNWEYAYDYHYAAYTLHVEGAAGGRGVLAPPFRFSLRS